jgi:hypothetical protein
MAAADEAVLVEEAAVEVVLVDAETSGREKCIKPLVTNVRKNAKFHSNLQKASRFIARNAIRNIRNINS